MRIEINANRKRYLSIILAGTIGSSIAFLPTNSSASGILTGNNVKNAVAFVSGLAATGAYAGSVAGPEGAGAGAIVSVTGGVIGATTAIAVKQVEQHPAAAIQTVGAFSAPLLTPVYIATHPTASVKAVKNVWNYFFGK